MGSWKIFNSSKTRQKKREMRKRKHGSIGNQLQDDRFKPKDDNMLSTNGPVWGQVCSSSPRQTAPSQLQAVSSQALLLSAHLRSSGVSSTGLCGLSLQLFRLLYSVLGAWAILFSGNSQLCLFYSWSVGWAPARLLPLCGDRNRSQASSWDKPRLHLICILSLRHHRSWFPRFQRLANCCFIYFIVCFRSEGKSSLCSTPWFEAEVSLFFVIAENIPLYGCLAV